MREPTISIIAAIDENRGLGKDNKLLFKIPEDLKRFRKLTLGHAVIMGRRTFESIGKPLKGRLNIIVTRNKSYHAPDCLVIHSISQAIRKAKEKEKQEIFIIGGGKTYAQTIDLASKLYLTVVKGKYQADTFFPDYAKFSKIIFQKEGQCKNYRYTFLELEKNLT